MCEVNTILLGSGRRNRCWVFLTGVGLGLFGVTFVAYELDIFSQSGGVVFIPFHAAIVGGIAAFWTGYSRNGLVVGWGLTYLSFLGAQAEWATDISPRPLIDRIAFVVQPDGLLALAMIGTVVALIGFTAGALARKIVNTIQAGFQTGIDT